MKQRTKYSIGIASIVLAGTLGLGSMAFASDGDDGTGGSGRHRFTEQQKCDHQDEIAAKAAKKDEFYTQYEQGYPQKIRGYQQ